MSNLIPLLFCAPLFYLKQLRFGPAGGQSEGDVHRGPVAPGLDSHPPGRRVRPPRGRQGPAAAGRGPRGREVRGRRWHRHAAGRPLGPRRRGGGRHSGGGPGAERVVRGRGVERRRGAAVAVLVALLPLVQLPDGVGPRVGGQPEVAEAVLGVLVLAQSAGGGALAGRLWQGLTCVDGRELVLGRRRAAREGVLSGWGAVEKQVLINQ